jgi:hypothetical protein
VTSIPANVYNAAAAARTITDCFYLRRLSYWLKHALLASFEKPESATVCRQAFMRFGCDVEERLNLNQLRLMQMAALVAKSFNGTIIPFPPSLCSRLAQIPT